MVTLSLRWFLFLGAWNIAPFWFRFYSRIIVYCLLADIREKTAKRGTFSCSDFGMKLCDFRRYSGAKFFRSLKGCGE